MTSSEKKTLNPDTLPRDNFTLPPIDEVAATMRYVYDTLQACLLLNHYCLLGDTAKMVKTQGTTPGTVEIAIHEQRMTPDVKATLILWGFPKEGNTYFGTVGQIPVRFVEVVPTPFIKDPDTVFFDVDEYKVPNPWDKYLESL